MNIIEGNRLIHEFLGEPIGGWEEDWKDILLGYDREWSFLMPVLEKISRIPLPGDGSRPAEHHETFYPRTFGMLNERGKAMVRINATPVFEADTLIQATWLACVDFIKWYNEHNKK